VPDAPETTHVEFRLLGSLLVTAGHRPVPLPGAAERALLALLLLSPGRMVTTHTLIDRLWGEDDLPADPPNALQLRVSKLRRALVGTDAAVVRDGVGYRADVAPESVDVEAFTAGVRAARARRDAADRAGAVQAYGAALDRWAGEPLADFADQPWAMVEAARLTQLRLAALTERAHLLLTLGRPGEVVADLDPVVGAEPTQETLAGLLMTALYQSGRQADALDVYARTRSVLDDELGLEPSAALRVLHQKVLTQDTSLAPVEPAPLTGRPERRSAGPASTTPGDRRPAVARQPTAPRSNVPRPVRGLIGRGHELDSLRDLLGTSRLVSLVGPGGAGKTATAFAVAAQLADGYPDGAWVVRLASVTDPDHVPLAAAEALGAPLDGAAVGGPARQRLLSYLAHRDLLLVLDNCEHVIDAAARLVDDLLVHCPDVTVLSTTREALAVPGEVQMPLGPLPGPPDGTPPADVLDYPAAQLFAERARAVRPGLDLTSDAELTAVADIVVALDGMPLAVELAAARASTLAPAELAARLTDRFGLLTTGARTADARQRTLRATVDWSHDLLNESEQVVFRRLAVFHGGWTLEAAEAVVAGPDLPQADVLDVLYRLVDRHMVTIDDVHPGQPSRYRMLETLRQYAIEKLAVAGEADQVAAAHVAYFRSVTDAAEWTLRGAGQAATLRRLRDELPNLRAAFGWLAAREKEPARVEDALHLAGGLGWFWHFGRHVEGRDVLRHVIALDGGSPAARARALQAVSLVERPRSCPVHPSPRCAETAAESLELFEQLGDVRRAAISRVLLAVEGVSARKGDDRATRSQALLAAADEQFTADDDAWGHALAAFVRMETYLKTGDAARALPTGRAAAAAFRALSDPWGLSAVLYHLGWGLRQFGRYAEAVPVLEEAIEVSARGGIQNTELWALADLGIALVNLGDVDAARARFDAAGAGSTESGDGAGHVLATYGYALLARVAGDWTQARARYLTALAGFEELGTPVPVGLALGGLGRCDEAEGRAGEARERFEQVRAIGETAGEPQLVAAGLEGLARLAGADGSPGALAEARALLAQADAVREHTGRPRAPYERAELAGLTDELDASTHTCPSNTPPDGMPGA
jgi:predicted ATPase/DNA-binding SARP family transcriptional activator/tetratricopeptide (TPR) repeat protein